MTKHGWEAKHGLSELATSICLVQRLGKLLLLVPMLHGSLWYVSLCIYRIIFGFSFFLLHLASVSVAVIRDCTRTCFANPFITFQCLVLSIIRCRVYDGICYQWLCYLWDNSTLHYNRVALL